MECNDAQNRSQIQACFQKKQARRCYIDDGHSQGLGRSLRVQALVVPNFQTRLDLLSD
jgi:hypothetical protein